jgi:Flp pilus assembly pilin Flp
MRNVIKSIWRDVRGITAVEFALVLPVLVFLSVGTVEFGRMILLVQKVQNGTFVLADLAARDEEINEEQLDNMFLAVNNILEPFEFGSTGTAVVTSVTVNDDGDPMINWQRFGSGTFDTASEIGEPGEEAALPEGIPLNIGETLIVSEVFFEFEPLFGLTAAATTLRRVAYVKPRLGTLATLAP